MFRVDAAREDYGVALKPDLSDRRRRDRAAAREGGRMKLRVGIDVGGTFTDVTAFDEDAGELVAIRKYLSNPAQPAAVMEEITRDLAEDFGADSVSLILHGSTAALNTMLEGKGARVGLITTRGFRDVYEIARQWRGDEVFNIFAPPPKMLLTRDRIHEVRERIDFSRRGDRAARCRRCCAAPCASSRTDGVEAIAVCFLFAYANPAHEKAAEEIIRDIAPDLYVSLSHEVNPEWREYERTASTVANAYIGPPVSRYLRELEALSLKRFPRSRALMMKSDGGAASARMLSQTPIQTVLSGPVAGVIGGRHLGDVKGIENLITFDTGGTSSDMAVLPGRPLFKSEVHVARHPLRTHTVDIETIGAGGGSIASVQLGGAQGRAAERRRQSGTGLLRPRRQRADAHRCARRARASQPDGAARRRHADLRARRPRRPSPRASPIRSTCRPSRRRGACSPCSPPT